ncbi:hypothetical protein CVT25_003083 [Psilocybe cyanescens]|uniref:Uncharacterized protein n=1 Tax=Psilocybe cyanescens TaxID=93625 RepID=A0A409X4S3_PSICY|nr:hypothetical protein CVT25_003083 [Psilocybe cyanescens]
MCVFGWTPNQPIPPARAEVASTRSLELALALDPGRGRRYPPFLALILVSTLFCVEYHAHSGNSSFVVVEYFIAVAVSNYDHDHTEIVLCFRFQFQTHGRSKPKSKSTRSWFYSPPAWGSPPPGYATLELEGSVDGGEKGQGDSVGEGDADADAEEGDGARAEEQEERKGGGVLQNRNS